MRLAIFNPQGNFDNSDSYWTEHPDFGGQLVYVKELAKAFDSAGHETVIFTRRIHDEAWPEFSDPEDSFEGTGVRIVRIPFGGDHFLPKESLWPYLNEYAIKISRWYQQQGTLPDAVTAHYADGGIAAALFEEATGVPYTFTAHSLGAQKLEKLLEQQQSFDVINHKYKFTLRLAAEQAAIGRAIKVFVSTRQEMEKQYGHPVYSDLFELKNCPFVVVPPGINQSIFFAHETPRDGAVREYLAAVIKRDIDEIRTSLPFVVSSSRLDPKKNVRGLVDAFAQSDEWQDRCNLLLAIRGIDDPKKKSGGTIKADEQTELQHILGTINEGSLWGKVAFANLDSQHSLAAAYRDMSRKRGIFCLASFYEGFGLATIEAMACGLPTVVTANGGGSEILRDDEHEYGVLINPENPASIAEGVLQILRSVERWRFFRKMGLERVNTAYNWDKAAELYIEHIGHYLHNKRDISLKRPSIPDYFIKPVEENLQPLKWIEKFITDHIHQNGTDH
jgi:sucrose-phosphate synthase